MSGEDKVNKITYNYGNVNKRFNLIECSEQITTICEVFEIPGQEEYEIKVVSKGMDLKAIKRNFPPTVKNPPYEFCLVDIIRAVIWEAYRDEGVKLDPGNVRHFWYTHVKFLIEDILRLGETASVKGALNTAWQDLVVSGQVTYEGMNIVSAKENVRRSFTRDSPFSNLIIAVEKENLFDRFEWIPELFNSTLITAGGQPSRAVSRSFIKELLDNGVDLDQQFYMATISDLDPAGYYIQEAFRKQLEKAIEHYGGRGKVEIRRLFVTINQVSPTMLQHKAMKCEDIGAKSVTAQKAENTKWEYFCEQTITKMNPEGGFYKDEGNGKYRAKMELDAFPEQAIENRIVEELLKIIKNTSDESLIMIPEIMRIFRRMKDIVRDELFKKHRDDWLAPIIEKYLEQAEELKRELYRATMIEKQKESNRFDKEVQPIRDEHEEKRDVENDKCDDTVRKQEGLIDDYKSEQGHDVRLAEIEEEIEKLQSEQTDIESDIELNCEDEFDAIQNAENERDTNIDNIDSEELDEIAPFLKTHNDNLVEINKRGEFREEQVDEFKRWKETEFNPVEQELKQKIGVAMDIPELDLEYVDLEEDGRTRPHIGKIMSKPNVLLVDNISAWDQDDAPVFEEDDLLQKASKAHHRNVEPHRRGFTTDFTDSMQVIVHEKSDGLTIDYPVVPPLKDIKDEIEELSKKIVDAIKDGDHLLEKDDHDDSDSDDEDDGNPLFSDDDDEDDDESLEIQDYEDDEDSDDEDDKEKEE